MVNKFRLSSDFVKEACGLIKEISILINPAEKGITVKNVCKDPADNLILASALAAEANFLVTGDDDLLCLGSYKKIKIIKPRIFEEFFVRNESR